MAIIKYNAIHTTPKKHLRYILNPDKNEQLRYVTGICCNSELDAVYADFKDLFEMYDDEKYALSHKHDGKNHIRIHSYVQSFSAGEVTPEQAHKIGVEWCKAMFGEDRPVIITTHTNTDHVHNHIAVCPYDIYGEKWKGNKTTLKLARTVSDRICLEHGLSVIKDPKKKSDISYAEWLAIRDNRSWKVKMADDIDRYIHDPSVRDIPSLVAVMRANGYEFTDERKLIAKPKGAKHAVSIYKLGHGYRYSSLEMRIWQKNSEYLGRDLSGCTESEINMIRCIQNYQYESYRKKAVPKSVQLKISYRKLQDMSELMCFMSDHGIRSLEDFMKYVNECRRKEYIKEMKRAEAELIYGYGSKEEKALSEQYSDIRSQRYKTDKMYLRYLDVLREACPYDTSLPMLPENGMLLTEEEKEKRRLQALRERQERERRERSYYSR